VGVIGPVAGSLGDPAAGPLLPDGPSQLRPNRSVRTAPSEPLRPNRSVRTGPGRASPPSPGKPGCVELCKAEHRRADLPQTCRGTCPVVAASRGHAPWHAWLAEEHVRTSCQGMRTMGLSPPASARGGHAPWPSGEVEDMSSLRTVLARAEGHAHCSRLGGGACSLVAHRLKGHVPSQAWAPDIFGLCPVFGSGGGHVPARAGPSRTGLRRRPPAAPRACRQSAPRQAFRCRQTWSQRPSLQS
jgi:hypothetical protein